MSGLRRVIQSGSRNLMAHTSIPTIAGFELATPNPQREIVISLRGVAKEDVPMGMEVWSLKSE
jgi:hypothetical protein